MKDIRYKKLANNLLTYSVNIKKGGEVYAAYYISGWHSSR